VQRFVRFLVYKPIYEHWALHRLLKLMKAIPIAPGRDAKASLELAREELRKGHVVCVFAEARSAARATCCRSSAVSRR